MPSNAESPRSIRLHDGRVLAYAEYGASSGTPVVFCHGSPGSRLGGRLLDQGGKNLGVRVVAPDRPGQGRSSPRSALTFLGWVDDLLELADELAIDRFSLVGFSGGGPYVAACAHEIPDRLSGAAMVSAVAPPAAPERGIHPSNRVKTWLLRSVPWLLELPLRLSTWAAKRDHERFVSIMAADSSAADRALLSRPEIARTVRDEFVEALSPGIEGTAQEAILYERSWGFDLAGIGYPIHVYQGERDVNVPPVMGRYLQNAIPDCRATFYPEEGHLSTLVNHTEEILSSIIE